MKLKKLQSILCLVLLLAMQLSANNKIVLTATNNLNLALPPTVDITSPANGATFIIGTPITIAATAASPGDVVISVDFLVDGVSIGTDNSAPYEALYTVASGAHLLVAKALNSLGLTGTDTVSIAAAETSSAYKLETITGSCKDKSFCLPFTAVDSVKNAIGYDLVLHYDKTKVKPTGNITINNALINPAYASYVMNDDSVQGLINIAVFLNNTAPANTFFKGAGELFCIEFTKSTMFAALDSALFNITDLKESSAIGVSNQSAAPGKYINKNKCFPYLIETITGPCTDPSFCLPFVAVDTVKNVIGYDLVLHYDKSKVQPTGNITLKNALINPAYVSYVVNNNAAQGFINISVFLNATAPDNTAFNGVGEVFCVEFTKAATLAAVDTALFNITDLQESYIIGVSPKLADAGKYINKKSTAFKGSLKFWTDNSPIKYDAANPSQYLITTIYGANTTCVKSPAAPVQPDLNGKFTYNTVNGTSIQIERDILAATNVQPVINGFDAALGNKVLVNDASFIPTIYQMIALDVNADGVVSAGDISQINQRSVKTITEFKQKWNYSPNGTSNGQLSKDWLFVDSALLATPAYKKSATFPANDGLGYSKAKVPVVPFCLQLPASNSTTCPVYEQSAYTGILLGDVNGNYDAIPADGQIKKVATAGTINLNLDQATTGVGYIDIPVSFNASEKVVALDFATQFNEKALSFRAINANVSYLTDAMANVANDDQTLRLTSNSNQAYEADKNIVSIRFNTLTGSVNSADLSNLAGYLNGNVANIEVKGNIAAGITTLDANNNVQVYPNPANDVLNIIASENAIVELADLQGRQIVISTRIKANEKQVINTENIASGVYMLKVYNDNFVSTQRVVVNQK